MRGNLKKTSKIGMKLMFLAIGISLVLLPLSAAQAEVVQLSLGTSSVGGFFYNIGASVAQCINKALPEVNVTAEFTEGSTENLRLIQKKKMQLAVISPMVGFFSRKGINMFKRSGAVDMKVVVRLLPNGNVWTTLKKNKTIKTINDFKGHNVGIGTGGIGVVSRLQLGAHGINFKKDVKPFFPATGELATLLKDGKVAVSFLTEGLAKMVTATHKIRIISWDKDALDAYTKEKPYFGKVLYPANHFKGVDYEVLTVDNGIQLVTHSDTPDALVYKLAKAIIENIDCMTKTFKPMKSLNPKHCASELGNPFHPGAIKYFKDAGLM